MISGVNASYLGDLVGRDTLKRLLAAWSATLVLLGAAIWFELPRLISFVLFAASLILATLAAICAGRTVTRSQARLPFRQRPDLDGRGAGVMALALLVTLSIGCWKLIYPRSWPTSVDAALIKLDAQLGDDSKRHLAYTSYDELSDLHEGLAGSISEQFGMWQGNRRLLHDCDPEYVDARFCSNMILSRYWRKIRAGLPATELQPLEALEQKMQRIKLPAHERKKLSLQDAAAYFNKAIRAQLPADASFTIHVDPALADLPVMLAWYVMEPISLRDALGSLAANSHLRIRKTPPDVYIERQ